MKKFVSIVLMAIMALFFTQPCFAWQKENLSGFVQRLLDMKEDAGDVIKDAYFKHKSPSEQLCIRLNSDYLMLDNSQFINDIPKILMKSVNSGDEVAKAICIDFLTMLGEDDLSKFPIYWERFWLKKNVRSFRLPFTKKPYNFKKGFNCGKNGDKLIDMLIRVENVLVDNGHTELQKKAVELIQKIVTRTNRPGYRFSD